MTFEPTVASPAVANSAPLTSPPGGPTKAVDSSKALLEAPSQDQTPESTQARNPSPEAHRPPPVPKIHSMPSPTHLAEKYASMGVTLPPAVFMNTAAQGVNVTPPAVHTLSREAALGR